MSSLSYSFDSTLCPTNNGINIIVFDFYRISKHNKSVTFTSLSVYM